MTAPPSNEVREVGSYVEPELFGVRVGWPADADDAEARRREAASRVRAASQRRLTRAMSRMHQQLCDLYTGPTG